MAPNGNDTESIPATESLLAILSAEPDLYPRMMSLLPNMESLAALSGRYKENRSGAAASELSRELARFNTLVKLAADNDPTLLQTLGITTLHRAKRAPSRLPLTAPLNFTVRHSTEHGAIIGKASPVKGGRSYLIEVCEGDPSIEGNWRHLATSVSCSKMEGKGLTPGICYWFRVRAVGAKGVGPASAYVSLMVI